MNNFINCAKKIALVKDMSNSIDFDLIDEQFKLLEFKENITNDISVELNLFDNTIFRDIKRVLEEECEGFLRNAYGVTQFENLTMTNSWANITKSGESHHMHLHPFSVVSAVLFLDDNPANYNLHLGGHVEQIPHYIEQPTYHIPLSALVKSVGTDTTTTNLKHHLVLFLSTTSHFVKTVEGDIPRRSIAFNTFWKGTTGPQEHVLGSYTF
jgi:uncharacterized protein (TIGR02466 family)